MKDNKLIKFLIPLVAVVVVFESIVLVNNLEKNNSAVTSENVEENTPTEVIEEPMVDFVFSADSTEMQVGKTYKVTLSLLPKESKVIDGVETYISYDVDGLKVTSLKSDANLPKAEVSEVDSESGMISNMIVIEDEGLSLVADEKVDVLTFSVTPKVEGQYTLKLTSGEVDKDHASLVVETSTSKSLGWTGGELNINVIK